MRKALLTFKRKYTALNKTQQKFIHYIIFIKIGVLILCAALLILAWRILVNKS